jgi:predicted aspartyl protease
MTDREATSSEYEEERPHKHGYKPAIKLGAFNGSTSLETFLAKFDNCALYYSWSDRDRLFQLRACLEGAAGQVLWDAGEKASLKDIIRLLRNRFGNEHQAERYRAELKMRRRRKGEKLQELYTDIRKLMAFAYRGPTSDLSEIVARDAFLDALNDQSLRVRVLEREPINLDEALNVAIRLEAYERTGPEVDDDVRDKRNKSARASTMGGTHPSGRTSVNSELEKQMAEMRKALEVCQDDIREYRREKDARRHAWPPMTGHNGPATTGQYEPVNTGLPGPVASTASHNVPPVTTPQSFNQMPIQQRGNGRGPRDSDICRLCGQTGHWARECTNQRQFRGRPAPAFGNHAGRANGSRSEHKRAEVYLPITVNGKQHSCLIDTGCEMSLIPRKLIPRARLQPTKQRIFAANGTEIPIHGVVRLRFRVEGFDTAATLLVSDLIEEMMLGIDWLTEHKCHWVFHEKLLYVDGKPLKLIARKSKIMCRRIYVEEDVVIPPAHQADIKSRMTWSNLRTPAGTWLVEPKQLRPGVHVARTLLDDQNSYVAVRVVNVSGKKQRIRGGTCIGEVEGVDVCKELVAEGDRWGHAEQEPGLPGSDRFVSGCSGLAASVVGPGPEYSESAGSDLGEPGLLESVTPGRNGPVPGHLGPAKTGQSEPMAVTSLSQTVVDPVEVLTSTLPTDLTAEQRRVMEDLIHRNADVFSKDEFDIGRSSLVQHRIDTGDNRPFRQPLRRQAIAHLDIIDAHVDQMLRQDIIEPAASPWASNVVLVRKKDGSLRFCIDYRRLNDLTYKDSYPLPRTDSCLDSLSGATYFSTLDLRSGYWQTAMDARDADKTAFVTRRGSFRFKVLSFGLTNAPSLFQRLMDLVLAGLTWETCLVYVDDIIVFSADFDEQVRRLEAVLGRLRQANLKLKPSKCFLFRRKVTFLGYVVSGAGVEPEPEKIAAVVDWPVPRSLTEVRAFLGLCSYYRKWIRDFASIAAPLHELMRKGERFEWNTLRQAAFEQLKMCLTTAPVLGTPRDVGTFYLDTDACDQGLGAVLSQEQEGELRLVAYASRSLTRAERVYCTTRKELLAIVFGLKQFRQYLLARQFVIRTDHAALQSLRKSPEPIGQQGRWLDLIEQFSYTIQHRAGRSHSNADSLSRRPCERELPETQCKQCRQADDMPTDDELIGLGEGDQSPVVLDRPVAKPVASDRSHEESVTSDRSLSGMPIPVAPNRPPVGSDRSEFRDRTSSAVVRRAGSVITEADDDLWAISSLGRAQRTDSEIRPIYRLLEVSAERPPWSVVKAESEATKAYWAQWPMLTMKEGVLYRTFVDADKSVRFLQLIPPQALRSELIRQAHIGMTGGHMGPAKTQDQVQRRAYWCGWRQDVKRFCRRCVPCCRYHRGLPPRHGCLQSMTVGMPMERLHVDLTGPHTRSRRGNQYILTCIDPFTKYAEGIAIRDKTAVTVARVLVEQVFTRYGVPMTLLSDLGREFENETLHEICRLLQISKLRTTAYKASTNGAVERLHRSMNAMLGKVVADHQKDWCEHLPFVLAAYRASRHAKFSGVWSRS